MVWQAPFLAGRYNIFKDNPLCHALSLGNQALLTSSKAVLICWKLVPNYHNNIQSEATSFAYNVKIIFASHQRWIFDNIIILKIGTLFWTVRGLPGTHCLLEKCSGKSLDLACKVWILGVYFWSLGLGSGPGLHSLDLFCNGDGNEHL